MVNSDNLLNWCLISSAWSVYVMTFPSMVSWAWRHDQPIWGWVTLLIVHHNCMFTMHLNLDFLLPFLIPQVQCCLEALSTKMRFPMKNLLLWNLFSRMPSWCIVQWRDHMCAYVLVLSHVEGVAHDSCSQFNFIHLRVKQLNCPSSCWWDGSAFHPY